MDLYSRVNCGVHISIHPSGLSAHSVVTYTLLSGAGGHFDVDSMCTP